MIECDAEVTPNQPWPEDGTARVVLGQSCNMQGDRILPLKHFPPAQQIIIKRQEYPEGLVVMPIGATINTPTTKLFCKIDSGASIIFGEQDWPDGCIGWFTE